MKPERKDNNEAETARCSHFFGKFHTSQQTLKFHLHGLGEESCMLALVRVLTPSTSVLITTSIQVQLMVKLF